MFFNSIPSVSVDEAAARIQRQGAALVDVRTNKEHAASHAQGARNYPLDSINSSTIEELRTFSEVYVICQSGGRSSAATKMLISAQINAINVKGGTSAWRQQGLPMA